MRHSMQHVFSILKPRIEVVLCWPDFLGRCCCDFLVNLLSDNLKVRPETSRRKKVNLVFTAKHAYEQIQERLLKHAEQRECRRRAMVSQQNQNSLMMLEQERPVGQCQNVASASEDMLPFITD